MQAPSPIIINLSQIYNLLLMRIGKTLWKPCNNSYAYMEGCDPQPQADDDCCRYIAP